MGDIQVFYDTTPSFGHPAALDKLDGPVFVIENTSGTDITNGVLSIGGSVNDSFHMETVPAGGRVFVVPGVSDDGGSGHTFFQVTGSLLDTSEYGPSGDDTQLEFTGTTNAMPVDSGVFTPAATSGPSNDGTVTALNFLGGPEGNADGPCYDCFGPKVVATLNIVATPCGVGVSPDDSLIGITCAMASLSGTLGAALQGPCSRRCQCRVRPALDRIAALLDDARSAARRKECRHKLAAARRAARALASRVRTFRRRRCFHDGATSVASQMAELASRLTALLESNFCTK